MKPAWSSGNLAIIAALISAMAVIIAALIMVLGGSTQSPSVKIGNEQSHSTDQTIFIGINEGSGPFNQINKQHIKGDEEKMKLESKR